ncbi:nicotinamidase/pyrazinamidase [Pelotomaculum schinkii]|uniref:Nicotinamidase/pyrazinamidase n=1 Tax=Pelotomaculum schinkii TaxID=78350 RepID=A0A4Y7R6D6_9FIRM|nr:MULTISPECIES: isochorismatase family cysteine hydrolase [Pelotomaculum]TEB04170.1 nicotinamidase/pyrazinamidase [Pelotomaculum schinkii]TEB17802.1 nicotinamidase/pyrazinamidase [Pelotomaculum sp. FP]
MPLQKDSIVKNCADSLVNILSSLEDLPILKLDGLEPQKTALVVVDMINAFAREGPLQSPRVNALIPAVAKLVRLCRSRGITVLSFADCHTTESPEYDAFPVHALTGTSECEIVDEIKEIGDYTLIHKNSTNGFLEESFQEWLIDNRQIENFIIVGDCTDICIQQFATSLKADFNRKNQRRLVAVPVDAVDTYDLGPHNGDLTHMMALYFMQESGVKLYSSVED